MSSNALSLYMIFWYSTTAVSSNMDNLGMRKFAVLMMSAGILLTGSQAGAFEVADSVSTQQGLTTLTESFTVVTTSGGGAGFGDDTTLVSDNTWTIVNLSGNSDNPNGVGLQTWQQGVPQAFGAQNFEIDGQEPVNGYALVNFASAQDDFLGQATVNNYLLTPELDLSLGGTLTFWTRAVQGTSRSNALQVLAGSGLDVTTYTAQSIFSVSESADIGTQLGDLQDTFGYPGAIGGTTWQQYVVTLASGGSADGRLAFRFFSDPDQAGTNGTQAGVVGIDTLSFVAVPEPTTGFGAAAIAMLAGSAAIRQRRANRHR
jgi:hypothetical protein